MRNYKMVLSYDGGRFKGWQKLGAGELTIQGTVEQAIQGLLGCPVEIHGSGRTDAGVHANGQVSSMKVPFLLKDNFREELNHKLPEDICILQIEKVAGSFHARYSAVAKTYRYLVDTNEKPSVFMRKYVCHFPGELGVSRMKKAAEYLKGTHDFSSFTDDKSEEKDTTRTIYDIQIHCNKGRIEFVYRGDGFLQHMVRILTGTLLEIGSGNRCPDEIKSILAAKERAKAGFMAPAKGLFLESVDYD